MGTFKITLFVGLFAVLLSPVLAVAAPSQEMTMIAGGAPLALGLFLLAGLSLLLFSHHHASVTPSEAVERLIIGNQRFMSGESESPRSDKATIEKLAEEGQDPFVAVLACADSRVPVENIFDMGFGDIFTIRVAGNVIGPDQLGSLEYAVDHLGVPLILILGHTNCGAINGAIAASDAQKYDEKHHVNALIKKIVPMVDELKENNPGLSKEELGHRCVNKNIWNNIKELLEHSEHLREMVAQGELNIHGAIYNIFDGKVHMLGKHREQDKLVNG